MEFSWWILIPIYILGTMATSAILKFMDYNFEGMDSTDLACVLGFWPLVLPLLVLCSINSFIIEKCPTLSELKAKAKDIKWKKEKQIVRLPEPEDSLAEEFKDRFGV